MPRKKILIAGASGLVGYAAMRHFGADPDCDVIALSRRAPDNTYGARFLPLDLTDAAACEQLAADLPEITHLVYAPGWLPAGGRASRSKSTTGCCAICSTRSSGTRRIYAM
jgi:NAD(P)-dependent dehydrogenase (short-subunit alcohol dehydrogenase family)